MTRDEIIAWPALLSAWREARAGKRRAASVDRWFGDAEGMLLALQRRLCAGYRFGPYRVFEICDPKRRIIAAAPFDDRIVHHAIVRAIGPAIERRLVAGCVACRVGRGGAEGARRLLRACRSTRATHYAKCDVRRYFASIRHEVLLRQLLPLCGDAWSAELLRSLIDSWHTPGAPGTGIPIGNLTSQLFANAHLLGVDLYMSRTAGAAHWMRYVDDMVWFADDPATLRRQLVALRQRLGALGLELHPRKTRIGRVSDGVDFAGIVATATTVRVRSGTVRRAFRHLRALRKRWRRNPRLEGRYLDRLRAVIALLRGADARGLLARRGLAWWSARVFDAMPAAALRGGNWNNGSQAGAFALNLNNGPTNRNPNVGFRCVRPGAGVRSRRPCPDRVSRFERDTRRGT